MVVAGRTGMFVDLNFVKRGRVWAVRVLGSIQDTHRLPI